MSSSPNVPSVQPITEVWTGIELLAALTSATNQLLAHAARVNALNVFPVPDGDTGTNMSLTMRAALAEAEQLPPALRVSAGEVAKRVEFGALMGARGNSGVILSQIFRGFAREIAGHTEITGAEIARALGGARDLAYKAVMEPVEGTMLTVIRAAAEQAAAAVILDPSLANVAAEALRGAEAALARTPELLARLKEAGVVDAGGQGVVYLLDGLDRYVRGVPVSTSAPAEPNGRLGREMAFLDRIAELHGEDELGYCTNFMIFGEAIPFERVRADLAAMGRSAVIVGDDRVVKVHIHTEDPGGLLSYAVRLGDLGQVKIDNMSTQVRTLTEHRAEPAGAPPAPTPSTPDIATALLAVAAGAGLAAALRDSGATSIVEGGQTMNPSIEELLSAVERAPAAEIILLPNNPNILMAAARVPELSAKRVAVVPSRSIPQGMAALQAFKDDVSFEGNVARMTRAVAGVRTVEITRADKDAAIDGLVVTRGQYIGLVDDKMAAAGDDIALVTRTALNRADAGEAALITIFTGDGLSPAGAAPLIEALSEAYPGVEIQAYDGGQPHYRYVIAVE